MCSNTLYISNVHAGSSLRWLSASTMTLSHCFDSTSDPEHQIMSQVLWVQLFEATVICPWKACQCAHTLCICLVWMREAMVEVAVSFNYVVMTPFWLHKWPRAPNYEPSKLGITLWGYCHFPTDSISMCSNTLYMSYVDAGSSLRWLSASTKLEWYHFDSTSDPDSQIMSQVVCV